MPQLVVCERCGATLYEDIDLRSPHEIIQEYDGKCPRCGKKLSFNLKNVEIRPA